MKIAIINQPLGNRGDEAAHKAFVRTLASKFNNIQFSVIFMNKDNISLINEIKVENQNVNYLSINCHKFYYRFEKLGLYTKCLFLSLIHPTLLRFSKEIKKYDLVICAPGGICMGGFMDWNHLWQLAIAKKYKKNVFYWGRSIGPFYKNDSIHKIFTKNSIKLLKSFDYISLRDSESIQIATSLQINTDSVVDSAFLEQPDVALPTDIKQLLKNEKYLVFVPNQLTWHFNYQNISQDTIDLFFIKLIEIVQRFYEGHKIVMLPQTYGTDINDYLYFIKLARKCENKNIIVINNEQNSDIQQQIIKNAAFVIGARYHSIVFAINNNIQFLALSYEHKMKGLLKDLELSERAIDIKDIFNNSNVSNAIYDKIEHIIRLNKPINNKIAIDKVYKGFNNLCTKLEEFYDISK